MPKSSTDHDTESSTDHDTENDTTKAPAHRHFEGINDTDYDTDHDTDHGTDHGTPYKEK